VTDLFTEKVTLFHDSSSPESPRSFVRFVIDKCQISGLTVEKNNSTVRNVVNAKTVISKDIARYKSPVEYEKLAENEKSKFYTVTAGDFVVFGEVLDTVTNVKEFAELQTKYKHNGIKVMSVTANIYGMTVDNITMTNV
jgi:hypothetical protein